MRSGRRISTGPGTYIGRPLNLNGVLFTVVGVTPQDFYGPWVGEPGSMVAVPLGMQPAAGRPCISTLEVVGKRLARRHGSDSNPDRGTASATAALQAAQPAIRQATLPSHWRPQDLVPDTCGKRWCGSRRRPGGVTRCATSIRNRSSRSWRWSGSSCSWRASTWPTYFLARADARRHELGVRRALGASRVYGSCANCSSRASCSHWPAPARGSPWPCWGSRLILSQFTTFKASHVHLNLPLDWTSSWIHRRPVIVPSRSCSASGRRRVPRACGPAR